MNEIVCIIRKGEERGLTKEAICASLCYEMARQEMETNAGYSLAFAYLLANGGDLAATAAENGDEIMGDESNHATRLKALANEFAGIVEPQD